MENFSDHKNKKTYFLKIVWKATRGWISSLFFFVTHKKTKTSNPAGMGELGLLQHILRMLSSQEKNYGIYKATGKYDPFSGKKGFHRNHPWRSPDTGINSQRH